MSVYYTVISTKAASSPHLEGSECWCPTSNCESNSLIPTFTKTGLSKSSYAETTLHVFFG